MVRWTSPLLALGTLGFGVLLGSQWDRGRHLAAGPRPGAPVAPPAEDVTAASIRGQTEDGLYAQLSRQYAQFEHVNRTFELVSRAVSPSVVHLVAHKSGPKDEETQAREYEETGSGVIVRGDVVPGLVRADEQPRRGPGRPRPRSTSASTTAARSARRGSGPTAGPTSPCWSWTGPTSPPRG